MQFHDLGPLWVESRGLPVPLRGQRMAAVLSVLLLRPDRPVRADRLIDCIWGDEPPPNASAALDNLMWRLRRILEPDRPARTRSALLRTDEVGYRLAVPADAVDSVRFITAAATVRRLDERTDAATIVETSGEVLDLWRGLPYEGVKDDGWLDDARARLAEDRLLLLRARIAALLATAATEQAAVELVPALAEHPYDERLWRLKIISLYRLGRPTAALDAYLEVRRLLVDELGLVPGPELRRVHEQVLRHDPALMPPQVVRSTADRSRTRIPRRPRLIGRAADVGALAEALRRHALVTVLGPVGCGKTAIAIEVAARAEPEFPDGVFVVDLTDLATPGLLTDRVRETLGLSPDGGIPAERAVIEFAVGRKLLLVLDNCEQIADPVARFTERLRDATGAVRIIATSRQPLSADHEELYRLLPLPIPDADGGSALAESPAVELFLHRLADDVELDGPDGVEVARICAATDGLPLSIELAAARARFFQLHEVAGALADHPIALGPARAATGRRSAATLREFIEASHQLLSPEERLVHRRLSALPSAFTLAAAEASCADAVPAERVIGILTSLADHSLLQADGSERPGGPTQFRQLVAIRAHAAEQAAAAGDAAAAREGLSRWVAGLISTGPRLGQPGQAAWYRELDDNRRTVVATLERELASGPTPEFLITLSLLGTYWLDRMHQAEGGRVSAAALRALTPAHRGLVTHLTQAVAGSLIAADQQPDAVRPMLEAAIAGLAAAAPAHRLTAADRLVVVAISCWSGDDPALTATALDAADGLAAELDDPHLHLLIGSIRTLLQLWVDPMAAAVGAERIVADNEEVGNDFASFVAYVTLSIAARIARDGEAGLRWTVRILEQYDKLGITSIADTLETRGNHYVNAGRPADAVRCYGATSYQNVRMGRRWPRHPGTDDLLATATALLTAEDYQRAWTAGEHLGATNLVRAWL